jgi:predicted Zn finger-like uncharacterized protein
MRFACDGCDAKYMISDDKVGPGGVKVRCKKCGHVILVRRQEQEVASEVGTAGGLAVDWWVAIADQPVGPVSVDVVQNHWNAGEIHPESLAWNAGLAEWSPISSLPELHAYLSGTAPLAGTEAPAMAEPETPPEAPPEEEWRPKAASALAALEDSELRPAVQPVPSEPEAIPAPTPPQPRDIVGVDPTGVVPLPIQGLDRTGEKRIARTPGPHGQRARAPVPASRPESRSLTVTLVVALLVVAALALGLWWLTK